MDDPVFVSKRRFCADRFFERLLQIKKVVRMYTAFERVERHGIRIRIKIKYATAFLRCPRQQCPGVKSIAAHTPDLLPLDHPPICFTERLEKSRRLKRCTRLRSKHGHHPDTSIRKTSLVLT